MSDNKKSKAPKKASWWTGVKAEFRKIIWPDRITLAKETTAVVAVSVLLGVLISILDVFIKFGIDFLVR